MLWRRKHREMMCLTFRGASPPDPPWRLCGCAVGRWGDGLGGGRMRWAVGGCVGRWADALGGCLL
jgi:hypothetical protein